MNGIPFRYEPAHTALIVVDVQNDFCAPTGSLASLGFDIGAVQQVIPRLQHLTRAAREAGMPVIFIRTLHDATTDSPQWLGRIGQGPGTERTGLTCRTGSWGSEFYEIHPAPGDVVVTKHRFSAFVGTNLDIILRTRGVESLLFTGVTTETCVESSLRDGLFHEYYVSLVEDCAASYRPEAHRASAEIIAGNFGTVVRSDQLIDLWCPGATLAR
jgi:nicotinamidase-related amidase